MNETKTVSHRDAYRRGAEAMRAAIVVAARAAALDLLHIEEQVAAEAVCDAVEAVPLPEPS